MPDSKSRLRACDVLNWDYLAEISTRYDPNGVKSLGNALAKLAYDLTQTGDENVRDQQLSEFLHILSDNTSRESTEEAIRALCTHLRCERETMRQFAKENGIKLKIRIW